MPEERKKGNRGLGGQVNCFVVGEEGGEEKEGEEERKSIFAITNGPRKGKKKRKA